MTTSKTTYISVALFAFALGTAGLTWKLSQADTPSAAVPSSSAQSSPKPNSSTPNSPQPTYQYQTPTSSAPTPQDSQEQAQTKAEFSLKTTLVFQTPQGPKEHSVVHGYTVEHETGQRKLDINVTGQALAIELSPEKWLLGTLNSRIPQGVTYEHHTQNTGADVQDKGADFVQWYANLENGFGYDIEIDTAVPAEIFEPKTKEDQQHNMSLYTQYQRNGQFRHNFPNTLVTFADAQDPNSLQFVDIADLETTFGPSYQFLSGRVEVTQEAPSYATPMRDILPFLANNDRSGLRDGIEMYTLIHQYERK